MMGDMFIILENINDRWVQAENTTSYESIAEAEEEGRRLELFDSIIVKYEKWI